MDIAAQKITLGLHGDQELRKRSISILVGGYQSLQPFLKIVVISFDDIQLANAHLSQNMQNLDTLLNELFSKGGVKLDESITEP